MPVQFVWRHPDRREVEIRLYVALRMVHLRGVQRLLVGCVSRGQVFVGVELAPETPEDEARAWSTLFERRYRVAATIDELAADAGRWSELYQAGGVGAFLNGYEREQERMEELRRRARRER